MPFWHICSNIAPYPPPHPQTHRVTSQSKQTSGGQSRYFRPPPTPSPLHENPAYFSLHMYRWCVPLFKRANTQANQSMPAFFLPTLHSFFLLFLSFFQISGLLSVKLQRGEEELWSINSQLARSSPPPIFPHLYRQIQS